MNICHTKNTKISVDHKEINEMSSTLSKCVFGNYRFEFIFQKKQDLKNTTRAPQHTHHARMYAKVYQCTHYGRKSHLTNFCYDRLNSTNKHIQVPETNPTGLKKFGYQTLYLHLLMEVHIKTTQYRERWYLNSSCSRHMT